MEKGPIFSARFIPTLRWVLKRNDIQDQACGLPDYLSVPCQYSSCLCSLRVVIIRRLFQTWFA